MKSSKKFAREICLNRKYLVAARIDGWQYDILYQICLDQDRTMSDVLREIFANVLIFELDNQSVKEENGVQKT